ncbi:MAG: DUF5716 family protein [Eubacterium sp.]
MDGRNLMIGIDFSSDNTQVAFLNENNEPQSMSTIPDEQRFAIPSVLYHNTKLDEWYIGDEAIVKCKEDKGILIKRIPETYESEEKYIFQFMKSLKMIIETNCGMRVSHVVITIEKLEIPLMETLYSVMESLGIKHDNVKIISHSESFIYYVLNQHKDIWINRVMMLDFSKMGLVYRKLHVSHGRKPLVASLIEQDFKEQVQYDMLDSEGGRKFADRLISEFVEKEFRQNAFSSVFLVGCGFMGEEWNPNTMAAICDNRRVFKGTNLQSHGAAYAVKEFFYFATLSEYIFACTGRTKVNVYVAIEQDGKPRQLVLSKAGTNWYEAGAKAEGILNDVDYVRLTVQSPITKASKTINIDLSDFPKRPRKTTRVKIILSYKNDTNFSVTVEDLGFGDFYETSGKSICIEINADEMEVVS